MKLEILKVFSDKVTGEIYQVGQVVDFKADRAKELLAHEWNLVKAVETAEKKPVVKRTTKPTGSK